MRSSSYRMHPATLYFVLLVAVILVSWMLDVYSVSYVSPDTGELVYVRSLLSPGGIRWLLRHFVTNFTGFPPLGMVLVAMTGVGVAYYSGLLEACIRHFIGDRVPAGRIFWGVIIAGILSNVIGDAGYIVLVPIASLLCKRVGIHPVVGAVVAFVSVACGYSANVLVSTMDPIMSRMTDEVTELYGLDNSGVGPLCNWLFMAASTVPVAVTIYLVTVKWLMPKFEVWDRPESLPLGRKEKRALYWALGIGAVYVLLVLLATFSGYGILRGVSGTLMRSPFIFGILFLISLGFGLMGLVYGATVGVFRSDRHVAEVMIRSMQFVAPFVVIAFLAAQMFACLEYSNLDKWIVNSLSEALAACGLPAVGKLLLFVGGVAVANLFMVSATGKWSMMAYVLVPYFAASGVAPEVVQCAFRVGDSLTNAITPFMFYMPLLYVYLLKYDARAGYLTVCRYTGMYTLALGVVWTLFFLVWYLSGLPTGV